jgi:ATP-binding cassette, subfamily A (ABC1), member 3
MFHQARALRTYTPSLTCADFGEKDFPHPPSKFLHRIHQVSPHCSMSFSSPGQVSYHLKSKDPVVVTKILQLLDVASYDVLGTSIEDIFLDLMARETPRASFDGAEETSDSVSEPVLPDSIDCPSAPGKAVLKLTDERPRSPFSQALTILHKRALIARRSWMVPLLVVLVSVCGACIPLIFLSGQPATCIKLFDNTIIIPESPTYYLESFGLSTQTLTSPPEYDTSCTWKTTARLILIISPDETVELTYCGSKAVHPFMMESGYFNYGLVLLFMLRLLHS